MINNLTAEEVRALLKLEPHATIDSIADVWHKRFYTV
jgi:hypothetical protein